MSNNTKVLELNKPILYNSLGQQDLTNPRQMTINDWNRVINSLRVQANSNAEYLESLHRWLFGDDPAESIAYSTVGNTGIMKLLVDLVSTGDVLSFAGTVQTLSQLPSVYQGKKGAVYFVEDIDKYYAWDGSSWVVVGVVNNQGDNVYIGKTPPNPAQYTVWFALDNE